MTEIATDWFGRGGASVFSENTDIFLDGHGSTVSCIMAVINYVSFRVWFGLV